MDILSLALQLDRAAFVAECPFPFLVAVNLPTPPPSQELFAGEELTTGLLTDALRPEPQPETELPQLYGVRKTQTIIPFNIILGRASTSDIQIKDPHVSKAHALFQCIDGRWEISDVGSRNGTWIGNLRVEPRGDAAPLKFGDILSFGYRGFFFLSAEQCWDRVHENRAIRSRLP